MTAQPRAREPKARDARHALAWLPWVIAILGGALSWAAWRAMIGQENMAIEARFQRDAGEREMVIEERLDDAVRALDAAAALFGASDEVEDEQFAALARTLLPGYPFIQALGWSPVVSAGERAAFEAAARAAGFTGYEITEQASGRMARAGERPEYVAVRFIEPGAGNEAALGFDVASEARRREALTRAAETGELALSETIGLVQDLDQEVGLLAFAPVFERSASDGPARRTRGFVVGVLRVEPLVAGALALFEPRAIDLRVLDDTVTARPQLLFSSSAGPPAVALERFRRALDFDIGGRRWRIESVATPGYVASLRSGAPTRTLLTGLGLTLLATLGSATLSGRSARDERMVAQRTAELRDANAALEAEIERRGEVERELSAYRDRLEEQVRARTAELEATTRDLRRAMAQQEEAEAALLRKEERLRLALSAAADGAWDWNIETDEVYFSDGWLESLGYERGEIAPTVEFWEGITHPDDLPEIRRQIGLHLAGETASYECENRLRTRSGEYRWNLNRGLVVARDASGKALRMVGTDTDITSRKAAAESRLRAEREMQQAEKLAGLGALAGGIAHDFNNMLVAILGGTDLALEELPGGSAAREPLMEARAAAGRAAELVRQIHAYSGQASFARERLELSALIAGIEDDLRAAVARNARLHFDLAPDLPPIEADLTQMKQVVAALLHNASEALAGRPGEISVATGRFTPDPANNGKLGAGAYVAVTVTDNGCGIAAEIRDRIFDPFFSTKTSGRGLGLAATLGIVRSHGGDVLVTSEVDGGTKVEVVLPTSSVAVRRGARDVAAPEPWRASGTALIVDDDAGVRAVAERMLRLIGFEVLTATDGGAGVEIFARHADSIVVTLLDMNMPGMNGAEVFRRIREIRPTARVLFSSGDSERASAGVTVDDPHASFLQKPYRVAELRARLESTLGS